MRNSDKEWEKFGKEEPYYSIMCNNKFRREQINEVMLTQFFKSGEDFIRFLIERIQTCVDPTFSFKTSLDFGCGVGRCTIPIAKMCQYVMGADVSESMLKEAKKNSLEHSVMNIEFIKSDDYLSQISGTFDLIFSFEVFHGIIQKRGLKIFKHLIEHLAENGIMAVDFLFYREESFPVKILGKFRKTIPGVNYFVNFFLRRPISEPLVEKHVYNLNKLLYILKKESCNNIHIEFYSKRYQSHILLFSQKKKSLISASEFL